MDIWQIDKLALFLIFFIPGFISMKIYTLLVPSEPKEYMKIIFEALGYSSLNFAAFSWLIIIIHTNGFHVDHKIIYYLSLCLILFVVPIVWPVLFYKLLSSERLSKYFLHPIQKPWDYVFGKREPYWIIIHLKDNRRIGGKFDSKSFASSYPSAEKIYLEEVWKLDLDGNFVEPIKRSSGIIISNNDILAVELFSN